MPKRSAMFLALDKIEAEITELMKVKQRLLDAMGEEPRRKSKPKKVSAPHAVAQDVTKAG